MSKREIAAAAAKKYILSTTNTTASAPPDRFHSVMTLITLGKAEEAENINREKFLQAILTQLFFERPVLVVPEAITDPQSVVVTVLDNAILTKLVCYHNSQQRPQHLRGARGGLPAGYANIYMLQEGPSSSSHWQV